MSSLSNVTIEKRNGCLWILMPRFIDGKNSLTIEHEVERHLDESIDRVVVDLADVLSISSMAIGLIVRLRTLITQNSTPFYFINISESCKDQLATVNLDKVLTVIP
jgi:anti-anti-sigma factor